MEWSKLLESPEGKPITRTEWQAFIWHTSNQIINTRHKYLEWKLILDSANHCSSCVYISSNFKPIFVYRSFWKQSTGLPLFTTKTKWAEKDSRTTHHHQLFPFQLKSYGPLRAICRLQCWRQFDNGNYLFPYKMLLPTGILITEQ